MTGFLREHKHTLLPLTGVRGPLDPELTDRLDDPAAMVMFDSGAFTVASAHAAAHGIPLPEAFAADPFDLDGFGEMWDAYTGMVKMHADRLWGYVEIDLGNTDVKRRNRSRMESDGLRPIPVYHPFTDPWDYFDELASSYDRVAVGNLVLSRPDVRKRIHATLWERRRRHRRNLWVHLLGVTPNHHVLAYPVNSTDCGCRFPIVNQGGGEYQCPACLQLWCLPAA